MTSSDIRPLRALDCKLDDFIAIVETTTDPTLVPHAEHIESSVPVYLASTLTAASDADRPALLAELANVLANGSGIFVISGAVGHGPLDAATEVFERIIASEKAAGGGGADHFAAAGANDRVWNALEKLCLADPAVFVNYFANDALALAATAWLGPGYQMTTQVNVVNPGGAAQSPHRDYHLGFMTDAEAEGYLSHIHRLSPTLTLQGAVAHCDMPVETGPTMYLPHSQKYEPGYLAWRRPEFQAYFAEHYTQLPLRKGDAVFFNPALFHAAGSNQTANVRRMANLLQICSGFTQAMELVDRRAMTLAAYPEFVRLANSAANPRDVAAAIDATADGYAFPTNLDIEPPVGGLAPPTAAARVKAALAAGHTVDQLAAALA